MRKQAPSLPTALLTTVGQPAIPTSGELPEVYAAIAPSWESQPALIKQAHDAGRKVHTWTVDDPAQIKRLIDLGVDGFFTNETAAGRHAVDAAGRGSGRKV
jgi:glycerophosphoryl diester phosphodiesterase